MSLEAEDVRRFADATERFYKIADKLSRDIAPTSNAVITVQAGGIGIAVVTCIACFLAGVVLVGTVIVMDHARQLADLNAYISAIYMQAPHLKPKDK